MPVLRTGLWLVQSALCGKWPNPPINSDSAKAPSRLLATLGRFEFITIAPLPSVAN